MTGPTIGRCAAPGCRTLTTSSRCSRHTLVDGWSLIRRFGIGGQGRTRALVATCYLPRFQRGDSVAATVRWLGDPPAADDLDAWQSLSDRLSALGAELGVRIAVDADG